MRVLTFIALISTLLSAQPTKKECWESYLRFTDQKPLLLPGEPDPSIDEGDRLFLTRSQAKQILHLENHLLLLDSLLVREGHDGDDALSSIRNGSFKNTQIPAHRFRYQGGLFPNFLLTSRHDTHIRSAEMYENFAKSFHEVAERLEFSDPKAAARARDIAISLMSDAQTDLKSASRVISNIYEDADQLVIDNLLLENAKKLAALNQVKVSETYVQMGADESAKGLLLYTHDLTGLPTHLTQGPTAMVYSPAFLRKSNTLGMFRMGEFNWSFGYQAFLPHAYVRNFEIDPVTQHEIRHLLWAAKADAGEPTLVSGHALVTQQDNVARSPLIFPEREGHRKKRLPVPSFDENSSYQYWQTDEEGPNTIQDLSAFKVRLLELKRTANIKGMREEVIQVHSRAVRSAELNRRTARIAERLESEIVHIGGYKQAFTEEPIVDDNGNEQRKSFVAAFHSGLETYVIEKGRSDLPKTYSLNFTLPDRLTWRFTPQQIPVVIESQDAFRYSLPVGQSSAAVKLFQNNDFKDAETLFHTLSEALTVFRRKQILSKNLESQAQNIQGLAERYLETPTIQNYEAIEHGLGELNIPETGVLFEKPAPTPTPLAIQHPDFLFDARKR